jgi:GNAT superfamily N-acetyltransferase
MSQSDRRQPVIRPVSHEDIEALVAMHERCSERTLWLRYLRIVRQSRPYVERLLCPPRGWSLVAEKPEGLIVALAHLFPDGSDLEASLLVEDAHQRNGIGIQLLRRLVRTAQEAGYDRVHGLIHAENRGALRAVRSLGLDTTWSISGGTWDFELRVPDSPPHAFPEIFRD